LTEPEEGPEQRDVVLLDAESRCALPEVGEVPWRSAEDRLDDVQKRSEGPLGATGHAYVSLGALRPQLGEQPRLSHARLADDADDVRVPLAHARPQELQQRQLLAPADEGGVLTTSPIVPSDQAVGLDRLRLPLHLERSDWLGVDAVPDPAPGRGGEEDLSGFGRLLQPRRDVDRIAHHA